MGVFAYVACCSNVARTSIRRKQMNPLLLPPIYVKPNPGFTNIWHFPVIKVLNDLLTPRIGNPECPADARSPVIEAEH
jgi:hypothetical protein